MLKIEKAAETDKGSRIATLVIIPTVSNKWQKAINVQTPPKFGFRPSGDVKKTIMVISSKKINFNTVRQTITCGNHSSYFRTFKFIVNFECALVLTSNRKTKVISTEARLRKVS